VPATLALMRALRPGGPILAGLHIVGGVLIGVALVRTRLVPLPLAVAATAAPAVHLAANLSGQFWLDATAWIVVATAGGVVAAGLLRGPGEDQPSVIGMRTPRASATSTASS
jgi:hypothetical protein